MKLREEIDRIRGMMGIISEQVKIPFKMSIPEDIMGIKEVFKTNGFHLYVVGGAVRDSVTGKKPKDYDLVTDALPDYVENILQEAGYRTLPTGKAFGVINVFTDMGEYEIATMREDVGSGRRPESVRFVDIETDVKRRDLTINALYYDIDRGEIIDMVGGYDDIKNNVVRTVGDPEDRFAEDRLRILRAIRFAARMGSDLDEKIKESLRKDSSLTGVSYERIRDEFIKGIKSAKSVKYFLGLLREYGLFEWIFTGLKVGDDFIDENDPILVISVLLMGNDVGKVQKRLIDLKYTVDESKDVSFLLKIRGLNIDNVIQMKKAQGNIKLSNEQILKFGKIVGMDMVLLERFVKFRFTVKGDDVMKERGIKQGKELGDLINQMELKNFLNGIARTN